MICFKDMTFCRAKCATKDCHRQITPEVTKAATKWWGKPGAPMAVSDFSEECPHYKREEGKPDDDDE